MARVPIDKEIKYRVHMKRFLRRKGLSSSTINTMTTEELEILVSKFEDFK